MALSKQIQNTLTNHSSSNRSIEIRWPKFIITGLIISSLIGFAITWFYLRPTPAPSITAKNSTQPRSYTGKPAIEALNTQDTAGEITTILSTKPSPTDKGSKIEAKSAPTESPTGWSADGFLDVLKEPHEDSDTASAIVILTKQNTVHNKDPYIASLLGELVDRVRPPSSNRENVEDSSDQAMFDTSSSIERTASSPLHFSPDGSVIVQHGDSLSGIALTLYRDGNMYTRIYEANKDVLENPNKLQIGTRLRIPETQH